VQDSAKIGPFGVLSPLGEGGMGAVWKVAHDLTGKEYALKVMTSEKAKSERYREAFLDEVRATAALEHPAIVRVFDSGEIDQPIEGFPQSSPYLVMELAHHTLREIDLTTIRWEQVKAILMTLLDALAHSHARGIVHRDIKPANVLIVKSDRGVEVKLSDFGLAYALQHEREKKISSSLRSGVSGTPPYMAPEQILGNWRDEGPWTDLYAVGCLTYWLCTGYPPFFGGDTERVLVGHLSEDLPPIRTSFPSPSGLNEWCQRLLRKSTRERYQCAADAAFGLESLSRVDLEELPFLEIQMEGGDQDATVLLEHSMTLLPWIDVEPVFEASLPYPLAPLPKDWRSTSTLRPEPYPPGLGIGLFGVRTLPMVGREQERDIVWAGPLGRTCREKALSVVILSGPSGTGKTKLSSWIAQRASELGAANALWASHSPISGKLDGVWSMFASSFRCVGLNRNEITRHLSQALGLIDSNASDAYLALALTELIAPIADPFYSEEHVRLELKTHDERARVFRQLLGRMTLTRPLIICIDDVQWGHQALALLESLTRAEPLPVMAILTVRDDLLGGHPIASEVLGQIEQYEGTVHLRMNPLEAEHHESLVAMMLGLEPALAQVVAEKTKGNPLFAVQLVSDWIRQDLIGVGPDGYCVDGAHELPLPETIHSLLRAKLLGVFAHGSPELRAVLIAAVLGRDVAQKEWDALCQSVGANAATLSRKVMHHGVGIPHQRGWSFVHGAMRECLEEMAREDGEFEAIHRECARVLQRLEGADHSHLRVVQHLLKSRDFEEAIPLLIQAIDHRLDRTSEYAVANSLLHTLEELFTNLGLAISDPRVVQGKLLRASLYVFLDNLEKASAIFDELDPVLSSGQFQAERAEVIRRRATILDRKGLFVEAIDLALTALPIYTGLQDKNGQGRVLLLLGNTCRRKGDLQAARTYLERALPCFAGTSERMEARIRSTLTPILMNAGEAERARLYAREAAEALERMGDSSGAFAAWINLGDASRFLGDFETAESAHKRSLWHSENLLKSDRGIALFNLGYLFCVQGRFSEALPMMEEARDIFVAHEELVYEGVMRLGVAVCLVAHGRWDSFKAEFDLALTALPERFVDPDIADMAERIGTIAQGPLPHESRRAFQLALRQYETLGLGERAENVLAILQHLDSIPSEVE